MSYTSTVDTSQDAFPIVKYIDPANQTMLRALYLSWRKAQNETPMQRALGILVHPKALA